MVEPESLARRGFLLSLARQLTPYRMEGILRPVEHDTFGPRAHRHPGPDAGEPASRRLPSVRKC